MSVEVLVGTFALHGVAHVVRAVTPPLTLTGGGLFLTVMVAVLVTRWRGRPVAQATAILGVFTIVALTTVHLVPMWGRLSEPWSGAGVHPVWWATLWIGMAGALWATVAASYELVRRSGNAVKVSA